MSKSRKVLLYAMLDVHPEAESDTEAASRDCRRQLAAAELDRPGDELESIDHEYYLDTIGG